MNKQMFAGSFLVALMVLSSVALAATPRETTGSVNVDASVRVSANTENDSERNITAYAHTQVIAECEAKVTVRERIACRIRLRAASVNSIEESCRKQDNPEACVRFQHGAAACYSKGKGEKAACLRSYIGFSEKGIHRATAEERRKYAALLMYELQERVEAREEAGTITEEQAADLIASIVDIKESLLNGTAIADIRVKMQAFKMQWQATMRAGASA